MGFVPKYSLVFSSINMLYLIPTIDFDLSLVKDNAAYGVSLLILQINQVFSITENYGANLTVLGQSRTNYSPPPGTLGVTIGVTFFGVTLGVTFSASPAKACGQERRHPIPLPIPPHSSDATAPHHHVPHRLQIAILRYK